jgi:hypothetical protein
VEILRRQQQEEQHFAQIGKVFCSAKQGTTLL